MRDFGPQAVFAAQVELTLEPDQRCVGVALD
jgi:hypothetical protein